MTSAFSIQHSALFEPVIGLEIHAQLLTETKIFCGCSTRFGAPPNTNVCPVCLGLPGALPVLNRRAVELAIRAAHALELQVNPVSIFARKNYFYPDLPKGYQISQYDRPLATGGSVEYEVAGADAARRHHPRAHRGGRRQVAARGLRRFRSADLPGLQSQRRAAHRDRDRAGPAVGGRRRRSSSAGCARSSWRSASTTATWRRAACAATPTCRCGRRARPRSARRPKSRTSTRSATSSRRSSTRSSGRSSSCERRPRRAGDAALGRGGRADACRCGARKRRTTTGTFPEPDLPPLEVDAGLGRGDSASLPELPDARRRRFVAEYALPEYDAGVLTQSPALADYFEATAALVGNAKAASNWIMGELTRKMNELGVGIEASPLTPGRSRA